MKRKLIAIGYLMETDSTKNVRNAQKNESKKSSIENNQVSKSRGTYSNFAQTYRRHKRETNGGRSG